MMQQQHTLPARDMMIGKQNIGEGWHPLLDATVDKLNELDCEWEPTQVKEKFGGLRFYIAVRGEQSDEAFDLLNDAEKESFSICEECGEDAECSNIFGWYRTLCETHKNELVAKRTAEREEMANSE